MYMHYYGNKEGKPGVVVTKETLSLKMEATKGSLPLEGKPSHYDGSGQVSNFKLK